MSIIKEILNFMVIFALLIASTRLLMIFMDQIGTLLGLRRAIDWILRRHFYENSKKS